MRKLKPQRSDCSLTRLEMVAQTLNNGFQDPRAQKRNMPLVITDLRMQDLREVRFESVDDAERAYVAAQNVLA